MDSRTRINFKLGGNDQRGWLIGSTRGTLTRPVGQINRK